jgi:hypothetical protein
MYYWHLRSFASKLLVSLASFFIKVNTEIRKRYAAKTRTAAAKGPIPKQIASR